MTETADTTVTATPAFGVMYRRHRPPEDLAACARLVELEGFDELWVVEDCFWAGGMSAASVALAVTARLRVGFGIAPAVARNAAIAAMDAAGLARMFPARFVLGVGHGVADWMRQIGALPPSQLAALEETVDVLHRLFAGQRVTVDGAYVHLDDVELVFPPTSAPPVLVGATGPKSLDVAARVADGLMLPEASSPAYVRAAIQRATRGGVEPMCAVYVLFAVDDDASVAREAVAAAVDQFAPGSGDWRLEMLDVDAGDVPPSGSVERIERFAVAGTAAECAAAIRRLVDAGATSVVLVPHGDEDEQIRRAAREVLPLLRT